MQRREFVKGLCAAGGALSLPSGLLRGHPANSDPANVKRVLVMFKCHLDVGFADTQANIMREYFEVYFPRAIDVANSMRQAGDDRYVWTTGSWLLYEYLDQASPAVRRRAEKAVEAGDLAWHALPFSWQTEFMDRSMIEGALGFSHSLDQRFGHTTTGAKMTDVPGHSRGLIAPLAAHGVKFLHIGVNGASTPPQVPPLFVWQEPGGASLLMMYHHEYGGITQPPGSDLAVAVEMRGDNKGPHTIEEITKIYASLRKQFPNAQIHAANLSEIATALEPYRSDLPVVTQEIGDTWIYGVASDPLKVAHYRELARLRQEWLGNGRFRSGDPTDLALLRRLTLCAEHTWGVDTKRLKDYQHYRPQDLQTARSLPEFQVAEKSWAEKRQNISHGVASLPQPFQYEALSRLVGLAPAEPAHNGLNVYETGTEIETAHWVLALDAQTGAISKLRSKNTGMEWASAAHPLALLSYQTLSKADYDRYNAAYVTVKTWWSVLDFGKPKIEDFGAQSRIFAARPAGCWSGKVEDGYRIVVQLRFADPQAEQAGLVAWPERVFLEIELPDAAPEARLNLTCFQKAATRLPEALWLSFNPSVQGSAQWTFEKVGCPVSPLDVVPGGNRRMHAVTGDVRCQDRDSSLAISSLDAPVVAIDEMSPLAFSLAQPDLTRGVHFSLYNNAWGTNYLQWYGDDMRFRFRLGK